MPISGDFYLFDDDHIDGASNMRGVYALYYQADADAPVYIGRAAGAGVTIRTRLRAHKRGDAGKCTQRALWFKQEIDSYPVARERELIDEYKYAHEGHRPRCNDVDP